MLDSRAKRGQSRQSRISHDARDFPPRFFFFFLSPPFFWPQCARRPLSLLSSPAISSFATEGNPTTVHSHRWQTAIFRPRLDRRKLRRQLWKKFFSNSSRLPNSFNFVPYNASLVNTDWISPPPPSSLFLSYISGFVLVGPRNAVVNVQQKANCFNQTRFRL